MFVTIDCSHRVLHVEVHDVGNFNDLHAQAGPDALGILREVGSHTGVMAHDDDHVAINPDMLREHRPRACGETWDSSFESMLDYARSKGWARDNGWLIAHVVPAIGNHVPGELAIPAR